jgi:hypothetical protein
MRSQGSTWFRVEKSGKFSFAVVAALSLVVIGPAVVPLHSGRRTIGKRPAASTRPDMAQAQHSVSLEYNKLPLSFEPNVGQSDPQVKYIARANGYSLFLTQRETVFRLKANSPVESNRGKSIQRDSSRTEHGSQLRLQFSNSNPDVSMTAWDQLVGTVNYMRGKDPKSWLTNIPTFARVVQHDLYPGIDAVYYGTQQQLEYDFVVSPGADPRAIALSFTGADKLQVDEGGSLVISVPSGDVRMRRPLAYQQNSSGERQLVAANYILRGTHVAAISIGQYDPRRTLVIDPILEYSTYLGGSNIDGANAIAVAQDKTAFVAGGTFSTDFPTAHPLQPNHGGPDDFSRDAFVAKLSADGSTVLYATYLGGENEDEATGIAVDTFGNAYVTGTTQSPHFPVSDTIPTINPECGGDGKCGASFNPGGLIVSNGFVVKLNPAGSALLYSSFVGYFEIVRARSIAVDANQIAYITGEVTDNFTPIVTGSTPPPPPFPITGNAAQPFFGGGQFDGFLIVISASGNSVVYCTYLGGVDEDGAKGVAVDNNRNAYVTGLTYSVNYPTTASAYQLGNGSNGDAFFTKINTTGGPFVYSTLLGGNGLDQGNSIAVDSNGNAYVAGQISSSTLASLRPYGGNGDAFVAKFNPSLSGAASLLYFTYLGGSLADTAGGVAVDSNGNAYVTGSTVSSDFPVVGAVFQPQYGGGNADAFVAKIDPSGANPVYSTFLGGSNTESGNGIAVDSDGSAYVAGQTCSLDFPLTNPEQASSGGNCDAFVSKVSILNGIILNPNGLVFQSLNVGASSQPQTVTLTTGDSSVAISSITMSGANPGDFAQTTNCGATVPSGAQCTFSVTFAPTAVGLRKANLNIADTENGNPTTHVVALTGSTSTVQLSASSLTFTGQAIGTTSTAQTITVTNVGTSPLTISGVVASSDFAESNNCTKAPLQPSTNCVISVTYSPTTAGSALGALTITDNVPGSPQVVLLSGTGMVPDFSIATDPASISVVAGQSASFTLNVSSISGFAQTISLSCGGTPTASVCSISPNSVGLAANGNATATVTVSTVARTMLPPMGGIPRAPRLPLALIYVLALVALFALTARLMPARLRDFATVCLLVLTPILLMSACNGGTALNSGSGTPAGTYQLVVTGAAGTRAHSVPVNLQVR